MTMTRQTIRCSTVRSAINVAAGATVLAMACFTAAQAAEHTDCDRACLHGIADVYFDALAKHDASKLPVTTDVKFTENGQQLKLGEGLWKTAGTATYRMEIFDPEHGDAGIQAVLHENNDLMLLMLRLKVIHKKISEVETIVARKNVSSAYIWAPETLKEPSHNFTLSIRPAEQNSRLELMAASDAYWRAFETNGTPDYHPAPFLPDANRFENGLQTTNRKIGTFGPYTAAEQFDRGLFKGGAIQERRYPVVDTERGVVLSIVRFGRQDSLPADQGVGSSPPSTARPLVAEFFAVKSGKIQEIQVVMTTMPGNSPTGWPTSW